MILHMTIHMTMSTVSLVDTKTTTFPEDNHQLTQKPSPQLSTGHVAPLTRVTNQYSPSFFLITVKYIIIMYATKVTINKIVDFSLSFVFSRKLWLYLGGLGLWSLTA